MRYNILAKAQHLLHTPRTPLPYGIGSPLKVTHLLRRLGAHRALSQRHALPVLFHPSVKNRAVRPYRCWQQYTQTTCSAVAVLSNIHSNNPPRRGSIASYVHTGLAFEPTYDHTHSSLIQLPFRPPALRSPRYWRLHLAHHLPPRRRMMVGGLHLSAMYLRVG